MCARLKEELRVVQQGMREFICKHEQGSILGESTNEEDVEENYFEDQHMQMEKLIEAREPFVFKTDNWCENT